jgi:hypothetical protein
MDAGSLLFYRADGVLIVRSLEGASRVANDAERAEANAMLLLPCVPACG